MASENEAPQKQPLSEDDAALREFIESAARAYFSTCRRLARAISRLKSKG